MPKFFFFTDIDLLEPQFPYQAFGEVISGQPDHESGYDKWRLSSKHTASSDPLAYAICDGEVIVQEDTSSGGLLVNIILKPSQQPSEIQIAVPQVKYYVYRGIKKSSLINGNFIVLPAQNSLSNKINVDSTISPVPSNCTGINRTGAPSFDDASSIDNLFYVPSDIVTDPAGIFQKYPISGGESIGSFDASGFSLEIILNRMHFRGPLSDFRNGPHYIKIGNIGSGSGTHWEMTHQIAKEQLLNYLDASAFYGSFQDEKPVYMRKSTDGVSNFAYDFEKINKGDIYEKILEGNLGGGLRGIFYNRNIVYIDLQNELGYSFNQMKNYNDSIHLMIDKDFSKILNNSNGAVVRNYYDGGTGVKWPIMVLTPSNTSNFPETSDSSTIRIAMPPSYSYNGNTLFYVACGKSAKSSKLDERIGNSNFFTPEITVYTEAYYTEFAVVVPSSRISGTNYSVSSYVQLKQLQRIIKGGDSRDNSGFELVQKLFPDHLFPLLDLKNPYPPGEQISMYVYDDLAYVDMEGYNTSDFIGKVGIARDNLNTTFFVTGTERRKKSDSQISNGLSDLYSSALTNSGDFINYIDEKEPASKLERKLFPVASVNRQITQFKVGGGTSIGNHLDLVFLSIIIPNASYNNLFSVASGMGFDLNLPLYLCIGDGKSTDLTTYATLNSPTPPNTEYLSFPLHLRGYKNNGGTLEIIQTTTNTVTTDPLDPQITIYGYPF